MRIIATILFVLLTAFCLTANAEIRQLRGVDDKLAELGFQMGEEVDKFADFQLENRTFVDKRNIIVPGASSQNYLVTFRESCQGLINARMAHRLIKNKGYLSQWDKFVTIYETSNIAWCEVIRVHEVEPV